MCKDYAQKAYQNLGENLRKYRKLKGLSQEELAFRVDTARNYISCVERAEKKASVEFLARVCLALDIKLENLFVGV